MKRSHAWTLIVLAGLLQGCGNLRQMVRHKDPLSPEQHVQLGSVYAAQGLKESARREFDAALRQDKRHLAALVARGNFAFVGNNFKEAGEYYRRALKVDPNHPLANNNLGMVYLQRGERLEKVEGLVQKAVAQGGPSKPYALETLATVYLRQGRHDDARKALDEAEASAAPGDHALLAQIADTRKNLSKNQ